MIEKKVALVTGGGRGIGRGISLKLAEKGWEIAVNYRTDIASATHTLEKIREKGSDGDLFKEDVTNYKNVKLLVEEVMEKYGRLDLMVCNVGDFIMDDIFDMDVNDWHHMLDSNLNSAFYCTKAVLPVMRKAKGGQIIYIGMANAERTSAKIGATAYSIAKTGVIILAKSVARQEGKYNIRANVSNPGFIQTEMYTKDMIENMAKEPPLGKLGKPKDIGAAVSFLASDDAQYISGAVINVAGGLWL
jgi:NAD(P)-dependent dehydrogenase (short-subunit alcohol dehydrogenase family)